MSRDVHLVSDTRREAALAVESAHELADARVLEAREQARHEAEALREQAARTAREMESMLSEVRREAAQRVLTAEKAAERAVADAKREAAVRAPPPFVPGFGAPFRVRVGGWCVMNGDDASIRALIVRCSAGVDTRGGARHAAAA